MAAAEEDDNVDAPADETTDDTTPADDTNEPTDDTAADTPADDPPAEDPPAEEDKPESAPSDPPADEEDAKSPPAEEVQSPKSEDSSTSAASPTTNTTTTSSSSSNGGGSSPKKTTRKRGSSRAAKIAAANGDAVAEAWADISSKGAINNYYLCKPAGGKKKKKKKSSNGGTKLEVAHAGSGGLDEMRGILKSGENDIFFGILRVDAADNSGSSRAKFIYVRFVGSKVGVMKKAGLTPQLAAIDEKFPVKHLTYDLTEELIDFDIEPLVRAFLQVGGAHKPDKYVFGVDQEYIIPKD